MISPFGGFDLVLGLALAFFFAIVEMKKNRRRAKSAEIRVEIGSIDSIRTYTHIHTHIDKHTYTRQ